MLRVPSIRITNPKRSFSTSTKIRKIGVVGAGQMGGGIAQVAAQVAKLPVKLMDKNQVMLDKSLNLMGMVFPIFM